MEKWTKKKWKSSSRSETKNTATTKRRYWRKYSHLNIKFLLLFNRQWQQPKFMWRRRRILFFPTVFFSGTYNNMREKKGKWLPSFLGLWINLLITENWPHHALSLTPPKQKYSVWEREYSTRVPNFFSIEHT